MEKYLVKHICKQASDNEDNSENTIETLDLYLETIDVYRTQKKISVSESEFKEKLVLEIKDSIEGINSWRVWHRGYIGAC